MSLTPNSSNETEAPGSADHAPDYPRCPPPADIREEVRLYDQSAQIGRWDGPRYRMTYRILGDGPPLIWAPGLASTYRSYSLILNRLSTKFRTIQYTYPGDEPCDGARLGRITHEDMVDDLFGLIDHLRIGRVFLVGISFGSTIVLKALRREPRRFPKAVVQGAFAHRRLSGPERLALFLGRAIPGTALRLPFRELVLRNNSQMDFPSMLEDRWPFYVEQNGLTPIKALAHRCSLVGRVDLRPVLPEISTEVLLVQGREDRIVPHRHFEELHSGLPRAEGAIMPTVGHLPHLTHAEGFVGLIGEWFLPCAPEGCPKEGPAAQEASGRAASRTAPPADIST